MAEINTIARPYAEAVFRVAKPAERNGWLDLLERLADISADASLRSLLGDPLVTQEQIYSVMEGALKTPLSGEAKNFLQTLIDNDRIVALPEIAAQFRELANSAAGSADAVIYSAFEMNASQVESLTAMLEKRFACKLTPAVVVDQSLIGGVRVVVGDQVLDSSVRGKLDSMRVALAS
jgi:F-type H+-transporting ATPase subunit delta